MQAQAQKEQGISIKEGLASMCKIMQDMRKETEENKAK